MTLREQLNNLATDFWWTGDPWANDIWKALDPTLWEELNHNPVALLEEADPDAAPASWKQQVAQLLGRYEDYKAKASLVKSPRIAYFCMEFGLHESFQIYSGGLGILAGDHIRSACDLKLDFVGVGLFYKKGYFAQSVIGGRQVAGWPDYSQMPMPIELLKKDDGRPLTIDVPFAGGVMIAQAWSLKIGTARLLLLDTDLPENTDEQRALTESLYGGGTNTRIGQEILLGIGGLRLLEQIGDRPDVFHMNEGHAAFLVVEMWIRGMQAGLDRSEAWKRVQQRCVFTTHTPVPAGHDRFYWDCVNHYLGPYRRACGLSEGELMSVGRENVHDLNSPLSMTVLALKGARRANGVSLLHGQVSRKMFSELGYPIGHITNGVHPTAWLAPELAEVFNTHLAGWQDQWTNSEFWQRAQKIPSAELWTLRRTLRQKLVTEARRILGRDVLNPDHLTIGFARRFATYKRGALIFSDPERLAAILDQGVQLIFAGKAHPADVPGQAVLATITKFSRDPLFRDRVIFLPDYNASLGRLMTQGSDVWLNNPRRPREASGTSGQKASLNGNLNLSILDGWWPEAYDGGNGWAIGDTNDWSDLVAQDSFDVESLYSLLETEIVPAFQQPKKWTKKMAHAIATCAPVYNTHRMVMDYLNKMYIDNEVEGWAKD